MRFPFALHACTEWSMFSREQLLRRTPQYLLSHNVLPFCVCTSPPPPCPPPTQISLMPDYSVAFLLGSRVFAHFYSFSLLAVLPEARTALCVFYRDPHPRCNQSVKFSDEVIPSCAESAQPSATPAHLPSSLFHFFFVHILSE